MKPFNNTKEAFQHLYPHLSYEEAQKAIEIRDRLNITEKQRALSFAFNDARAVFIRQGFQERDDRLASLPST